MTRARVVALMGVLALACAKDGGSVDELDGGSESPTTDPTTTGDGDGDPTTTGDGDGDPTTTGDGDGDPTTTGDGDGDPTTGNDACEDGDSGNAPFDDEAFTPSDPDDPDPDEEPHGGFGFVPDEDIGGVSECNIWDQDCPVGEKCVPWASSGGSWDANKCVPVTGDGMVGDACIYSGAVEATDDCDENSACWGVNAQGMGICTAFCDGGPDTPLCPEGFSCLQGNNGSLAFCVPSCNPISQDCPEGDGCFWSGDGFKCASTTTELPAGEACGFINDCAEGLSCVTGELVPDCTGAACCAEFCDLDCGGTGCSQPGTSCVAFYEGGQAPDGEADIGICIAP